MDPRTLRLAAYLMSRGLPVGDLATLDARVLEALAAAPAFGRAEVEACLAIGEPSADLLVARLAAAPARPAAPAPAPATPAQAAPAQAATAPAAPAPAAPGPAEAPAPAPAAEPPPEEEVYVDEGMQAEIREFIKTNAKFKAALSGVPGRIAGNDKDYVDMLMRHYRGREAKDLLGIRPAVLLGRFVEMWAEPDARPRARKEYSLHLVFPEGEIP